MRKKITMILFLIVVLLSNSCFAKTVAQSVETTNSLSVNETVQNSKITTKSSQYEVLIEDDANLLNSNEKESLKQKMQELTEYGNIILKTIKKNTSSSTASYAKSYYTSKYKSQSGTMFLIDMDKRIIYIFSMGDNEKIITKSKAEIITDNIYKFAKAGNYYKTADEAFTQIQTLLQGGQIPETMKYISNGIIAVMIALFVNFFIFSATTKNKAAESKELIKGCETFLENTPVQTVRTGTRREYSPPSSSSSGGGGGFSGGGGSSGGSGGGHSF